MRKKLFVAALLTPFLLAAGGKPVAVPAVGKKKPVASASASVEPSAVSSSSVNVVVTTASAPAIGVSQLSPLTPRIDETPPVMASASGKPGVAYDDLMAEVAALRARVSVISNAVWKSRIAVTVRLSGSHARIASAKLLVDNAQVWQAPKGFSAEDDTAIFDGGVAPGLHAIALEVERRDDRDETFRTIDRTTATLMVPQGKRLEVSARLDDDSDMGGDFPSDGSGKYDLRLRLKAKAVDAK